jgi:hypothetical protein
MLHFRNVAIALAAIVLISIATANRAAAVTTPTSAAAITYTAASLVPATGSGCNEFTLAPWYNCTTVTGSGLKIQSVSGYVHNPDDGTLSNMHVELYGPDGLIQNCGTFSVGADDNGPICKWTNPSPNTNEPAGDYCSVTWQYEGGNSYEEGGPECVDVHS